MNNLDMPIVRLQVDRLARSLEIAVVAHLDDQKMYLQEEIQKRVAQFDFMAEVQKQLPRIVERELRNLISAAFYDPKVGEALRKALAEALLRGTEKR